MKADPPALKKARGMPLALQRPPVRYVAGELKLHPDWQETNEKIKATRKILYESGFDELQGNRGINPYLQLVLGTPMAQEELWRLILYPLEDNPAFQNPGDMDQLEELVAQFKFRSGGTFGALIQATRRLKRAQQTLTPKTKSNSFLTPKSHQAKMTLLQGTREAALVKLQARRSMFTMNFNQRVALITGFCAVLLRHLFGYSVYERAMLNESGEYRQRKYQWPDSLVVLDPETGGRLPPLDPPMDEEERFIGDRTSVATHRCTECGHRVSLTAQ